MASLAIVGCGIRGTTQMTPEAMEVVVRADRVLSLSISAADVRELTQRTHKAVETLDALYVDGDVDATNYERIVDAVLARVDGGDDVALVTYGHPRVGVSFTHELEQACAARDVSCTVVPGVSSFDAMLNDLARDPLERGTFIVDANRLLLFKFKIDPTVDLFVYHVCSIGVASTNFLNPSIGNRIDLLRDYLLRVYPTAHPVTLLDSAYLTREPTRFLSSTVGELDELVEQITFSSTLYVPPLRPPSVDRDFLALLRESAGQLT